MNDTEITTVVLDDTFRDDLARALRSLRHNEIGAEIEELDGGTDCGGSQSGRCGGCGMCLYMQSTWSDYTDEGWARDRAAADQVIASVRGQAAFRLRGRDAS